MVLLATDTAFAQSGNWEPVKFQLGEVRYTVAGTHAEEFRVRADAKEVLVISQVYEELTDKMILIEGPSLEIDSVRFQLVLGVLQYGNDEVPAWPLSFKTSSTWGHLPVSTGEADTDTLHIPGFWHGLPPLLGFADMWTVEAWLEKNYFEEVRIESYEAQRGFFSQIMADSARYAICCPEYLIQAREKLAKDISDFETFQDLGLEIVYHEMRLEVRGLVAGVPFRHNITHRP